MCGEQNKQNLYSLNRMTLYKFSCAAMGLQVCVGVCTTCVNVCSLCVCVCASGRQLGAHRDRLAKTLLYMCGLYVDCAHVFVFVFVYIMEKFFIEFAQK